MKDVWFPLVMILRGVHGDLLNSSVTRLLKVDSSGSLINVGVNPKIGGFYPQNGW